jgi:hypothetical protein
MTIQNLTSIERHMLAYAATRPGDYRIDCYGPEARKRMKNLTERGILKPCSDYSNGRSAFLTDLGREVIAYLESKKEQEDALWDAVLKRVEHIQKTKDEYSGTSRSCAEYTHHDDGTIDCHCTYKSGNKDGSSTVFTLTATWKDGQILVQVEEATDHADWFWGPGGHRDEDDPMRRVVVDGVHYYLGEDRKESGTFKGFAGRRFEIEFFDGRRVVTNDLWYQGRIPPKWRERFPDNARFVPQPQPKPLAERLGLGQ